MDVYNFYKRKSSTSNYNGNPNTVGAQVKDRSDSVMEATWWNDPQSKVCYLYDYFHDDQPELCSGMTYEHTTKFKIDAKFIVTTYGSIDKDQVPFHLMFRPSQKLEFNQDDELYYYETEYKKKYGISFPIGLYLDIPNEKGVYVKWIIIDFEEGNQLTKYTILPCDYRLQWINYIDNKRVKNQMWGCSRSMNS